MGDAQDPPVLGAEGEDLSGAGLPNELLVEFADDGTGVLKAQLVVAAVRNGAAGVVQRKHRAAPRPHAAVDAVEGHPRLQFAHPGAGVAPGEQLDRQVELLPGQPTVGGAGADGGEQLIHRPILVRAHGDDRLAKHVQGVLHDGLGFDVPLRHRLGKRRRIEQVLAMGGIEGAAADLANAVAGAP